MLVIGFIIFLVVFFVLRRFSDGSEYSSGPVLSVDDDDDDGVMSVMPDPFAVATTDAVVPDPTWSTSSADAGVESSAAAGFDAGSSDASSSYDAGSSSSAADSSGGPE